MSTKPLLVAFLFVASMRLHAGEFPDSWTWDTEGDSRARHAALEGKPMPLLDLKGWINGQVNPQALKGKVVIVDFYATWCGPCMRAIPHNNELMEKYKDKGVVIIGVCTSREGQEKMGETVHQRGIKYPTAQDPELKSQTAWQVQYFPTYAVVDRRGIVRAIGLQPEHVEEVVKKILEETHS